MRLKIKHKLAISFFAIGLISMTIIAAISYYISKKTLEEQTFSNLTYVRNSKAQEISRYFNTLSNLASCLSENAITVKAFLEFNEAFEKINEIKVSPSDFESFESFRSEVYFQRHLKKMGNLALSQKEFNAYLPINKEAVLIQKYLNTPGQTSLTDFKNYESCLLKYDTIFRNYVRHTGFGGLLILDSKTGSIIYSVNRLSEIGGSVLKDSLSKTNLAKLFHALRHSNKPITKLVDYENYFPTDHLPKSFIGSPIFFNGKNVGVLAFRIPLDTINTIMTFNKKWKENGLGNTGEAYLFGEKYMMRSQSRFFIEDSTKFLQRLKVLGYNDRDLKIMSRTNSTIRNIKILTTASREAISGETNVKIIRDYRNEEVLSAYMPLTILGLKFGLAAEINSSEAFEHIQILKNILIVCFCLLLFMVVIIALLFARSFSKPINELTLVAEEISLGNYNSLIRINKGDEIGHLANSFNTMQEKILNLISNLKLSNRSLEEKQNEIVDSIKYARKIQDNILADQKLLEDNLHDHFVYFKPKDVVSGDFYWALKLDSDPTSVDTTNLISRSYDSSFYLAVCDSTGHGVPGAFMSLLNVSYMNEAIALNGIRQPAKILDYVRNALSKAMTSEANKDGMDGVLICINPTNSALEYAGAYNQPVLIRNNQIIVCEVDRMPIGKSQFEKGFFNYEIKLEKGDMLYMLSDGFADQFGGPLNKKYKHKNLLEFLLKISNFTLKEQHKKIETEFENWKGSNDQVDDVIIFGIQF